jgi:predicted nucleic acid-binding protein
MERGSTCVLDTNVMINAHQGASAQAASVLKRCASAEITGILPSIVWEELCHKLMVAEAVAAGHVAGPNPSRKLAERPELVRGLAACRESLAALGAMGLHFEAVSREDVLSAAVGLQKRYGLLTNDSIIAACAIRLGVDYLVTSDEAFAQIGELKVVMVSATGP